MEEQAELRRQFVEKEKASRPKIRITEKQQENWKDALISELKVKLAANEEYIQELEENAVHPDRYAELETKYQELQRKYNSLKTSHDAYVKRYESDIEIYFKSRYQDKLDEIKALKTERKELIANRDQLIYQLYQATDGKKISE